MTFVLTALSFVGDFIKRYPWQIALILSLLLNWRLYDSRETWKERAKAEVASHEQTKQDYKAAQEEARVRAEAEKRQKEKEYEDAREHAEASYAALSGKYHAAVMRLQSAKAAPSSASGSDLPGTTEPAESSYRPYSDAIILERSDALICAENQSRLETIQAWWESVTN